LREYFLEDKNHAIDEAKKPSTNIHWIKHIPSMGFFIKMMYISAPVIMALPKNNILKNNFFAISSSFWLNGELFYICIVS